MGCGHPPAAGRQRSDANCMIVYYSILVQLVKDYFERFGWREIARPDGIGIGESQKPQVQN